MSTASAKRLKPTGGHLVLAYVARTEDTIRSNIVYSVCRVLNQTGSACDLRQNPSDLFTTQTWLTRAQDIAQDLRGTYPSLKLSNAEAKPYFSKKFEAFCDLLFSKIVGHA